MGIDGIVIRRAEPRDAEDMFAVYSCASTYGGTLQLPYPSLESVRKRLSEPSENTYLLVADVQDRVVGSIAISTTVRPRRRHAGGLAMGVHEDWQSQGVGTAMMKAAVEMADRWLELTRLELEVFVDNDRAIRLYKRFGFEHEGTLRQFAFRDGSYVDVYYMARLRAEQLSVS